MAEKEVKELYGLMAGSNAKTAQIVAKGTKSEMEKLMAERVATFKASKASIFAKVIKL